MEREHEQFNRYNVAVAIVTLRLNCLVDWNFSTTILTNLFHNFRNVNEKKEKKKEEKEMIHVDGFRALRI